MKIGKNVLFRFRHNNHFIGTITEKLYPGYKLTVYLEIDNGKIKTTERSASISKSQIIKKGYKSFVYDNPEYFI